MPRLKNIPRKHWGKLTVIGAERVPWMREGPEGRMYDSGDDLDFIVTLACECGKEFKVSDNEFKGTHIVKSCVDCAANKDVKIIGRPKRPGTAVTVQLTLEEMVLLAQYTEEKNEIEVALKLAITEYLQLKALL